MPSAISVTSVSMRGSFLQSASEGKRVAEDAGAGPAAGENLHELDGVDLDPLAVRALAELAAGRALEHELEGLAVELRPLSHDVGQETTVVVGGEVHPVAGRGAQVDAVGPHVAGEPDVEQVPQP